MASCLIRVARICCWNMMVRTVLRFLCGVCLGFIIASSVYYMYVLTNTQPSANREGSPDQSEKLWSRTTAVHSVDIEPVHPVPPAADATGRDATGRDATGKSAVGKDTAELHQPQGNPDKKPNLIESGKTISNEKLPLTLKWEEIIPDFHPPDTHAVPGHCSQYLKVLNSSYLHNKPCSPEPQQCEQWNPTVPNIVHYIWMYQKVQNFTFQQFVAGLSVLRFQRPLKVMFWYNQTLPAGKYWSNFQHVANKSGTVLELQHRMNSVQIHKLKVTGVKQAIIPMSMDILYNYGGIYLDLDMILLRSLLPLMCYGHTQASESLFKLSTNFIMAAPKSKFIQMYFSMFEFYDPKHPDGDMFVSLRDLAQEFQDLIHVEAECFMRPSWDVKERVLYNGQCKYFDWSKHYAVHLWKIDRLDIDQGVILFDRTSVAQILYYVYYGKYRADTLKHQHQ